MRFPAQTGIDEGDAGDYYDASAVSDGVLFPGSATAYSAQDIDC